MTIDEWKDRSIGSLMDANGRWENNVRVPGAKRAVLVTDGTICVNDDEDVMRAIRYLTRRLTWLIQKPGLAFVCRCGARIGMASGNSNYQLGDTVRCPACSAEINPLIKEAT